MLWSNISGHRPIYCLLNSFTDRTVNTQKEWTLTKEERWIEEKKGEIFIMITLIFVTFMQDIYTEGTFI